MLCLEVGSDLLMLGSQVVSKVAKSMRKIPKKAKADDPVQVGCWKLKVWRSFVVKTIYIPHKELS